MATYSEADFERIAVAIDKDVADVRKHKKHFEDAARWFRSDSKSPKRPPPSQLHRKLGAITKTSNRLLKQLGVIDPNDAADGPNEAAIFDALISAAGNEDAITRATGKIGRLSVFIDATRSAADLAQWASKAADDVKRVGALTVEKGHHGDVKINDWIVALMGIYKDITGREPATSVGSTAGKNEGIAQGPLIRFLQAAGAPIGLEFSEDAWRSRTRTILNIAPDSN